MLKKYLLFAITMTTLILVNTMVPMQAVSADSEAIIDRHRFLYEDIYFTYQSNKLSLEAKDALNKKAQFLKQHPEIVAIIEGHTDDRNSREANIAFGEKRAGTVKSFLIQCGIESWRLIAVSYGEEHPIDPKHTEEARAKNRRVHFQIKDDLK